MQNSKLNYLKLLAETFSTIEKAAAEIINLQSILNLPKGTEHFISDIHGEYASFSHVIINGSGAIQKKIEDVFGHTLSVNDKNKLAALIYYPKERIEDYKEDVSITLYRLIEICKTVSSKYTKSKVRKAIPKEYAYVIEELISEKPEVLNKEAYYEAIINTIIELERAEQFIIILCELIQRLVIDHLHVLGDIFDRGPSPHLIMDKLMQYHSLDIQWGNHDILWMGAGAGNLACIATVIRNCIYYGNIDILEEGYGINMLPLATLALELYKEDPCQCFAIESNQDSLVWKMHKAITIILFKLEGQLIKERPEFQMEDRMLLHRIEEGNKTIMIEGKRYEMKDSLFPSIEKQNPYVLTTKESDLMQRLKFSFLHCEKLQEHIQLLLNKGNLYKVYNGNLLFHGSIPMNQDGSFRKVLLFGKEYSGKRLYDELESYVRKAFVSTDKKEQIKGIDILWYLWKAPNSPLCGRNKIATFERYFLKDEEIKKEKKNEYYNLIDQVEIAERILEEFECKDPNSHIINGHVPVHRLAGESPVKCGGKVMIIDGGFSKSYWEETGIAGYTLIYNSYGLTLTGHEPFISMDTVVEHRDAIEYSKKRILVGDTDAGKQMKERIKELKELIHAYREGLIIEIEK